MKRTNEYKYLGFMISNKGDNMINIRKMKHKSIGIIKKIFSKLESLNLKQYYFECSTILMNVMLTDPAYLDVTMCSETTFTFN